MRKINSGFSVIEVLLAAALFVIFSTGIVAVVLQGFDANRLGNEESIANQYASEGIEAVRSIKNQAYSSLVSSTGTGIVRNGSNVWAFSGTNNVLSKYTRVLTVSDVQRDGSGNIVASGGTVDPNTKKITSTVNWNVSPTRSDSVVLNEYLTNWRKSIIGNWTLPALDGSIDLVNANDGLKVAVSGNYAYVVRATGSPNFQVIDISNPAAPSVVAGLNLSGTLNNIFISGSYAYISSASDTQELQIVNISTPTAPVFTGSYDAAGSANANGIFVVGTTAYLTKDTSGSAEFYVINVATPSTPTLLGSLNLSSNANELVIMGSYAYIASGTDTQELTVVNISNSASPSLAGSLDLTGTSNGLSIAGFGSTIVLGRADGTLSIIDVAIPTSPTLTTTYTALASVNDISLGNSNNYAFIVTNSGTQPEFQVVDISTLASPILIGSLNLTNNKNGVFYDELRDRAIVVGAGNPEFYIIKPQ